MKTIRLLLVALDEAFLAHALLDDVLQALAELVLVLLRIPVAGHGLDQLLGELLFLGSDAVVGAGALGNVVFLDIDQFLRVAHHQQQQRPATGQQQ